MGLLTMLGCGPLGEPEVDTIDAACSVLLIESCRLLGDALATQLRSRPWVTSVRTSLGHVDALAQWASEVSDVVLVGMEAPDAGFCVSALKDADPEVRIIAFSVAETEEDIIGCAEMGVAGLLSRTGSFDDLELIVSNVIRGLTACTPRVAAALLKHISSQTSEFGVAPRYSAEHLTPREREVLSLIELGWTNKQIAQELCIEVRTVKNHVHNLLEKLRVSRRGEAAARLRSARIPALEVLRDSGAGAGPSKSRY
jgi:two-component system nitrate/nitrite response regulator NarL